MKKIILAASLILAAGWVEAQTVNIATTAVPFLRISPDARAGGMGDMGVATTPGDANGVFHNLAKLPFAEARTGVAVNYTPWMHEIVDGVSLTTAAGYHQLDEQQAVGMSLRYFNIGDYAVTDYSGTKLGAAHPREYSIDGGYTRKLSGAFAIGLAFRYIHSDLAGGSVNGETYKAGNAVATDVSLYYDGRDGAGSASGSGSGGSGADGSGAGSGGSGFTAGLVLSNLGTKINYTNDATMKTSLPTTIGLGLGYTVVVDEMNRLTISTEAGHLLVRGSSEEYQGAAGIEYEYDHLFSLRAGYHVGDKAKGDYSFFTTGVGLRYHGIGADLSYLAGSGNGVTRNPLSNTVRLGVNFTLGKVK